MATSGPRAPSPGGFRCCACSAVGRSQGLDVCRPGGSQSRVVAVYTPNLRGNETGLGGRALSGRSLSSGGGAGTPPPTSTSGPFVRFLRPLPAASKRPPERLPAARSAGGGPGDPRAAGEVGTDFRCLPEGDLNPTGHVSAGPGPVHGRPLEPTAPRAMAPDSPSPPFPESPGCGLNRDPQKLRCSPNIYYLCM